MKKIITTLLILTTISSCAYVGFGIGIPLNGNAFVSHVSVKKNS